MIAIPSFKRVLRYLTHHHTNQGTAILEQKNIGVAASSIIQSQSHQSRRRQGWFSDRVVGRLTCRPRFQKVSEAFAMIARPPLLAVMQGGVSSSPYIAVPSWVR